MLSQLAWIAQVPKWVCSAPSASSGRAVFTGGVVVDTHKMDDAYPVGVGKLVGGTRGDWGNGFVPTLLPWRVHDTT